MQISVFVLAVLVAAVAVHAQQPIHQILQQQVERDANGQAYKSTFSTTNGIQHAEQGSLRSSGPEGPVIVTQGENQYVDPAGQVHKLTYTADENGYHPRLL